MAEPAPANQSPSPSCPGCRKRDREIAGLKDRMNRLERRLEEAQRAGKRQAAPFSKGPAKMEPKRPGRKPGTAYGQRAARPVPPHVDETLEAVLPEQCERCGDAIEAEEVLPQYQTDIPPVRPVVTQFNVHVGRCRSCGRRVQGRHPRQTSAALGAAANLIGPNALSLAAHLQKTGGLSHDKIVHFFEAAFSLQVGRSTLVRGILRLGRRLEPLYAGIERAIQRGRMTDVDETGWRVAGRLAWLWVFVSRRFCLYAIRDNRGFETPAEILGPGYRGVLGHDGWAPYDRFQAASHQTCLAHLFRRSELLLAEATRGAVRFPRAVKAILKSSLALRERRDRAAISPHGLAVAIGKLEARVAALSRWRLSHEGNRKFRNHLIRHASQLFTFLHRRGVEATNWRAEQAIRPAVVNRKVWGGNRTPDGARAQEVIMSVLRTCQVQGHDPLAVLREQLRLAPNPQALPTWAALGP